MGAVKDHVALAAQFHDLHGGVMAAVGVIREAGALGAHQHAVHLVVQLALFAEVGQHRVIAQNDVAVADGLVHIVHVTTQCSDLLLCKALVCSGLCTNHVAVFFRQVGGDGLGVKTGIAGGQNDLLGVDVVALFVILHLHADAVVAIHDQLGSLGLAAQVHTGLFHNVGHGLCKISTAAVHVIAVVAGTLAGLLVGDDRAGSVLSGAVLGDTGGLTDVGIRTGEVEATGHQAVQGVIGQVCNVIHQVAVQHIGILRIEIQQRIHQCIRLDAVAGVVVQRGTKVAGNVTAADGHVAACVAVCLHDHDIQAAVHIAEGGVRLSGQCSRQAGGAAADHQNVHVFVLALGDLRLGRPVCQVGTGLGQAVADGIADGRAGKGCAGHGIHAHRLVLQNAGRHLGNGGLADKG